MLTGIDAAHARRNGQRGSDSVLQSFERHCHRGERQDEMSLDHEPIRPARGVTRRASRRRRDRSRFRTLRLGRVLQLQAAIAAGRYPLDLQLLIAAEAMIERVFRTPGAPAPARCRKRACAGD